MVLSVGQKCVEQSYSLIWMSGKEIYMTDKDGKCTPLTVRDNIPYIKLNDPKKRHEKFCSCESAIIHQLQKMIAHRLENERRKALTRP